MNEVVQIRLDQIADFPQQEEIYGVSDLENEFIASVEERGVITPLILCKSSDILKNPTSEYTCISGHRRREAATIVGHESVPAYINEYNGSIEENYDIATIDFLSCNMQREKTPRTRLREFLMYKQKLCRFSKSKNNKTWENTIFENKAIFRILKNANEGNELSDISVNSTEILKEITGYSKYEQDVLIVIFDNDWLQRQNDKLDALGVSYQRVNELAARREAIGEKLNNGEVSMNEALTAVKKMYKDTFDAMAKKKEKADKEVVKRPAKEVKAVKKQKNDLTAKDFADKIFIRDLSAEEVSAKISLGKPIEEYSPNTFETLDGKKWFVLECNDSEHNIVLNLDYLIDLYKQQNEILF